MYKQWFCPLHQFFHQEEHFPQHPTEVCRPRWSSLGQGLSIAALSFAIAIERLFLLTGRHQLLPVSSSSWWCLEWFRLSRETARRSRHPTSTGRFHVFHCRCQHSSNKGWYLAFFLLWASSIRSSHGTISSGSTTFFVDLVVIRNIVKL